MSANNLVVISEILEYKYTFGRKRKPHVPDFPEIGNDCCVHPKKCLSLKKSGRYFRPESSLFRCPIASANNIRRAPRRRRSSISSSNPTFRRDRFTDRRRRRSSIFPSPHHRNKCRLPECPFADDRSGPVVRFVFFIRTNYGQTGPNPQTCKSCFPIVSRYLILSYIFPPRTAPTPSRIGHKADGGDFRPP